MRLWRRMLLRWRWWTVTTVSMVLLLRLVLREGWLLLLLLQLLMVCWLRLRRVWRLQYANGIVAVGRGGMW